MVKKLNVLDSFCLGVNAIIGSGIFLFPGSLAAAAGPASILAFLVCGILLITVALCYAELASIYKRNGGSYVYAKEAFGPGIGFGVGWMAWVTSVFSWAAVANAVSSYLCHFYPQCDTWDYQKGIACGIIFFFGLLNYRGIKLGGWTVDLFTLGKLIPLILFILVGFFHVSSKNYQPFWGGTGDFSLAIFLALWPLQGFETTPIAAGETENPRRAIPMAAIGSLLFATLIYVLIQAVAVGVLPTLASSNKPLADAAAVFLGPFGATILALGALISTIGYNAGNALGSPRYLSALAEDHFLPQSLAKAHPRFATPSQAILLTTGVTFVAALFLDFKQLVDISNLAVITQYLSTCLAVLWLRYYSPQLERTFKMPFGYVIAFLGSLISVWLMQKVAFSELKFSFWVLVAGFLLMFAFRKITGTKRAE